jgi:DNA-binding response OmpR family regulator
VLLVLERPALVELIRSTLNHGVYSTRAIATTAEVEASVAAWLPHLLLLDMDLDGTQIMALINHKTLARGRLPVIGLTRWGDLKTKLAAFEAGVDDILTVPFAPEELLARVIAVQRRSYSDAVTFTPIIELGDLEIDILKRTVRAGAVELHLTSLEQSLLYLLAANAGRVITRARRSSTHCGVLTTCPIATSSTVRFATSARDSRTTGGSHISSPQFHAAATASYSTRATDGLKLPEADG